MRREAIRRLLRATSPFPSRSASAAGGGFSFSVPFYRGGGGGAPVGGGVGGGWGPGWGWGGWGGYSSIDVDQYVERSVVIDIYDNVTKRPVWHGVASNDEYSDDVNYTKLDQAVVAALAKFPPQPPVPAS